MKLKKSLIVILLLQISLVFAQNTYNLKPLNDKSYKKCEKCIQFFKNKAAETQLGLSVDLDNNIIFYTNDAEWFYNLIKKNKDGLAVDIVLKSDFNCTSNKKFDNSLSLGTLLQPIYLKKLKKNTKILGKGKLLINLGQFPKQFIGKEYELNLLVIQNSVVCYYQSFINIPDYKWSLLDMGLYTDTITYKASQQETLNNNKTIRTYNKRIKFIIPFKKDQTKYSANDIKALYDTLNFSDFIIKKISIRVYSSIEGDKSYNLKLQKGRAESIVKALQTYQPELINYEIATSENWMEFYQSIKGTEFKNLSNLTKQEIKEKLKDKTYASKLEPILKNQRKAVVEIDFVKRYDIENLSVNELQEEFKKAIKSSNIKTATDIQKVIFSRIVNNETPSSFINKLEIPEKKEYGDLLNSNTVYKYFLDEADLLFTYNNIKKLKKLIPNSKEISYNYLALKFHIWLNSIEQVDHKQFKKEILSLKQKGIATALVNRMLVNYNIILTEMYMYNGEYAKKDKTLKSIYYKYKTTQPSSSDLLSMAQYFVAYAKYDWAIKLLKPYITKVDVDEDLLFYYINLTIYNPKFIKKAAYKQILLNAIDINKDRFCKIFNAIKDGGVSFQLLKYKILKSNYCQSCND